MTDDLVRLELERAAARRVWRIRDHKTPGEGITWADWYQRRFGRTLDEAAQAFKEQR